MNQRMWMGLLAAFAGVLAGPVRADDKVDFAKQILPIIESNCIKCHDAKKQKGDLRLDSPETILKGGEHKILEPGKGAESEIYRRITLAADDDDIMPPKGDPLTKAETDLIKAWIDEGATFGEWKGIPAADADKPVELLSTLKADPADEKAMEALHGAGVAAMRLANDVNFITVNFRGVSGTENADGAPLALLGGVSNQLTWLDLANSKITDAGLKHLAGLKNLTRLHLENTGITDAGLAHLKGLTNLEYLNLYNTQVTDAGLAHLTELKHLKKLYLWQSKVTKPGAAKLQESLPAVVINLGWEEPPKKEEEVAAADKIINATCPISGKAVVATFVFEHQGQKIGFCCADCQGKFSQNPGEFIAKVKEFKAPAPAPAPEPKVAKAINAECPLSGKAVVANFTFAYKGQTIGFCCGDCLAKFEKSPEEFIAKVKEFKDPGTPEVKTVNAKCPFTGKPVNPEFVVAYKGVNVGFCCGDCCAKFAKSPEEFASKVPELQPKQKAEAKPVNKECPISGKPINVKFTFTYKGATIGFCCGDCCAKFGKEPEKYISKVKELNTQAKADEPINKSCPLSGKPIDAKFVVAYQGQKIALCCGDCCKKFAADPAAFIAKVPEFKPAATN